MAAEYEVNIKINTKKVETDLNTIDNKIKNLGKSATSKEKSLERIVDKRARLMNRINEMEAKGLKVAKLRKQMGKATEQQSRRDLANAQKEYRILERSIRLEQSKLRILRSQRQGFPASPIRGIRSMMGSPAQIAASGRQAADPIRGRADLVGSPAYYEAQQKAIDRLARQGGPSDPVKGHANLVGSPKYFEEQQKAIDKAARQGGARSPLKGSKDLAGSPAYFDHLNREISRLARQGGATSPIRGNKDLIGSPAYYEHQRKELEKLARRGGPRSPIRGGANMPGSPLALQAGMNRLGQVGLGAGFPLLFGGGPGSVIGGGLGGLTGSFGAQIALSAAGQQIDQLIGRTVASAESLTSVGTALDFLRERSLFSSKESEQLARKLENQGDLTGIATLVTEELNEALGPDGIQKMQDLAEQTRLAKEQWGQLTTNLELLISGPLTEFLAIVNATLGIKVAQSNFARSLSRLQERDSQRLKGLLPSFEGAKDPAKAIASNLAFGPNMAGGVFNMQGLSEGALISFTEQMNSILRSMDPSGATIPVTEEDKKRFKRKGQTKKNKLPELEAERDKLEKLLDLEEKRFSLQLKEDDAAVLRLQAREKVAKIAEEVAKIKASDLTAEQKAVALQIQGIENARVNLELSFKLSELERKRQEKFEDTIEDLDHQLALARATTEEERERLRIEEALRKLREDDKLSQPQLDDIRTRMEALAEEKNLINTFLKETREQIEKLNDPMFQVISLAQTLGNAFSESFKGIVTGSMTAQQALANLFQRTADNFLDMAAQMIAAQIKMQAVNLFMSFFPSSFTPLPGSAPQMKPGAVVTPTGFQGQFDGFAANGGPVTGGKSYIVGERGPELFTPGVSGGITPNHALGGANVTVNVDASGSSVQGDGPSANQLGKAIGAVVQAELIKQKRPGGLLTR